MTKVNPYFLSGLSDSDSEFFTTVNLSKNNPPTMKLIAETWDEEDSFTYAYDAEGKPITRKAAWAPSARDLMWTCK